MCDVLHIAASLSSWPFMSSPLHSCTRLCPYYSSFSLLDGMLLELYYAANKYQVLGLLAICESRILENLTDDNCIDVFRLSDDFETKQFKFHVLQYIVTHYSEVCSTEGYKSLVYNYDKESQSTRLLDELNEALAVYNSDMDDRNNLFLRMNCLGMVNSIILPKGGKGSSSSSNNSATNRAELRDKCAPRGTLIKNGGISGVISLNHDHSTNGHRNHRHHGAHGGTGMATSNGDAAVNHRGRNNNNASNSCLIM